MVGAANGRVRNVDTSASTYTLDLAKASFALPGLALPQPTWAKGWDWLPKRNELVPGTVARETRVLTP